MEDIKIKILLIPWAEAMLGQDFPVEFLNISSFCGGHVSDKQLVAVKRIMYACYHKFKQ